MIRRWITLFALLCALSWGADAADTEHEARAIHIRGSLALKMNKSPKRFVSPNKEIPLRPGDILETGPLSATEIILDGKTVITLRSKTRVRIKTLFLQNTQIDLIEGSFLMKTSPAPNLNKGFIFKLPTAMAVFRNAELIVEGGDGTTRIGVFDLGEAVVAGKWGAEHVILKPRSETLIPLSNVPRPVTKLTYFKRNKKEMTQLRQRSDFWKIHWKPLGLRQQLAIRKTLTTG